MIDALLSRLTITPAAQHVFRGPLAEVAVSIEPGQTMLLVTRSGLVLPSLADGRSWMRLDWRWDTSHYPIRGLVMAEAEARATMAAIEGASHAVDAHV